MLDPNFTIDNVVFDSQQFIELINSGKVKMGSAVMFEELGVAANSRNWWKEENIWLSFITQVFRTMNLIVFYTVPKLEYVDGQIAKLAHAHIEAVRVDLTHKQNVVKVYDPVSFQSRTNKWYKRLVGFARRGKGYKISQYRIYKASNLICKQYEEKREKYLSALRQQANKYLGESKTLTKQKEFLDPKDISDLADKVVNNRERFMDDRRFYLERLMDDYQLGMPNARRVKSKVMEKLTALGFLITWR
jgi:hypothetical protein